MKKHILFLLILITSLSLVITLWKNPSFDLIIFLNIMFTCSLGLTVIGAIMFILNSGFFDGYVQQFKKFFRQISRSENMANELEEKNNHSTMHYYELPLAITYTATGLILTIISSIFSVIVF